MCIISLSLSIFTSFLSIFTSILSFSLHLYLHSLLFPPSLPQFSPFFCIFAFFSLIFPFIVSFSLNLYLHYLLLSPYLPFILTFSLHLYLHSLLFPPSLPQFSPFFCIFAFFSLIFPFIVSFSLNLYLHYLLLSPYLPFILTFSLHLYLHSLLFSLSLPTFSPFFLSLPPFCPFISIFTLIVSFSLHLYLYSLSFTPSSLHVILHSHVTSCAELPEVFLLQKTPSSPVTCMATGFYPDLADLFWRKDGEQIFEDVEHGELLPNHDGTFQMSVELKVEVTAEVEGKYECVFQLSGVKEDLVTKLERRSILSNASHEGNVSVTATLAVLAVVVLLAAGVFIIIFIIKRRRSRQGEGHKCFLFQEDAKKSLPSFMRCEFHLLSLSFQPNTIQLVSKTSSLSWKP
ncbi:uncharacterized protein [Nerophis lumbriciformis]|uniref:uncharacterized protein isoform X1 n=1 Tax=Nerophis lumbriciformis TaxID=546530 RepID=UPI002AE055B9|nr:uncharacterized protein LOC133575543 isoform X1 [Nerophis lumbriciformis]